MDGLLDRTLGSDPVHQGSSTSRLDLPALERADQFMAARDGPASPHLRARARSSVMDEYAKGYATSTVSSTIKTVSIAWRTHEILSVAGGNDPSPEDPHRHPHKTKLRQPPLGPQMRICLGAFL